MDVTQLALTWVGWPNGLASFLTSTCKSQKNILLDITQLALTWDGLPNDEKLALTCMQI